MFNRESLPLHSIFPHSCIAAAVFSFLTCHHQSFSHRCASSRDAYYLPGYYCVLLVLLYRLTLLPLPLLQRTLGGNSSLQFTFCGTLLDWFSLNQFSIAGRKDQSERNCHRDPFWSVKSGLKQLSLYKNSAWFKAGIEISAAFRSILLMILLQN